MCFDFLLAKLRVLVKEFVRLADGWLYSPDLIRETEGSAIQSPAGMVTQNVTTNNKECDLPSKRIRTNDGAQSTIL